MEDEDFVGDSASEAEQEEVDEAELEEVDEAALEVEQEEPEEKASEVEQEAEEKASEVEQEVEDQVQQAHETHELVVGTLVEVESRTWPGINKLGGSGRVVRVHEELDANGDTVRLYDVRYVLGGFEKRVESEFVQSSKLLEEQSSRETVPRDFYYDGYINKPFEKKQEELEKKRKAHGEPEHGRHKRRKKAHPSEDRKEKRTLREDAFIVEGLEAASRTQDDEDGADVQMQSEEASRARRKEAAPLEAQTPTPKKHRRRKHRIVVSSDESSDEDEAMDVDTIDDGVGDAGVAEKDNAEDVVEYDELEEKVAAPTEDLKVMDRSERPSRERRSSHTSKRRKTRRSKTKRYVGGYNDDDDFIQPEGNPADLPDDVIQATGLQLATTLKALKLQVREVFAQQQLNLTAYQKDQREVNKKMKNLSAMSYTDMNALYQKVCDMEQYFTKTLVNAGEDAMNTILRKISKKAGDMPKDLEVLDQKIYTWNENLKEYAPWARQVKETLESTFEKRNEAIPRRVTQTEASSDSEQSSYSSDEWNATYLDENVDTFDDVSFDYDYKIPNETNYGRSAKETKRTPQRKSSESSISSYRRKKLARNTRIDDFLAPQDPAHRFKSNIRLVGKQRNITPSDPRFQWLKLARRKQQRTNAQKPASGRVSHNQTFGSASAPRARNGPKQDDSMAVQARRMQLRDKRYRGQPTAKRSRDIFFMQPAGDSFRSQAIFTGISFDDSTPEKRLRHATTANPTIHPTSSKVQQVDWESVFEGAYSGAPPALFENAGDISGQYQQMLSFGYPICGPLTPQRLLGEGGTEFDDPSRFDDVVVRRASRLRQQLNDLRLQEGEYMVTLSKEGLNSFSDEACSSSPEWIVLVSLEEAYHTALASFCAQLLDGLIGISPAALPSHLETILEQVGALVRQLPDCDSLFEGREAYYYFLNVDSKTTPLLTAISRAYWYCLHLLLEVKSTCTRLMESQGIDASSLDELFLKVLPANRVNLAVVLFLFDLYLYFPSSHRLDCDNSESLPSPALALWVLVRDCTTSARCSSPYRPGTGKEEDLWTLLQTVYQEGFLDEVARCRVRNESCGGYLREFPQQTKNEKEAENHEYIWKSQLLSEEAMWDLLTLLSQLYGPPKDADPKSNETLSKAKWNVVKEVLHSGKHDFLPFQASFQKPGDSLQDYQQYTDNHTQQVLERVLVLSKLWDPSVDIVESIIQRVWQACGINSMNEVTELPNFLKQLASTSEGAENYQGLASIVDSVDEDDQDFSALVCKIIWVQATKLKKRIHHRQFRGSVLKAIPSPPEKSLVPSTHAPASVDQKKSGKAWDWGKEKAPDSSKPADTSAQTIQPRVGAKQERLATSVLLTVGLSFVCFECGDQQKFPSGRRQRDIKDMERDVSYFCTEILRWTSGKPKGEVIASQALFVFGTLLLDKNSMEFSSIFRGLNTRLEASINNLQSNPLMPSRSANNNRNGELERHRRLQTAALSPLYYMRDLTKKLIATASFSTESACGVAVEICLEHILSTGLEACLYGAIRKSIEMEDLRVAMEIFQLLLPRAQDKPSQCTAAISAPSKDDEFNSLDQELAGMTWDELCRGQEVAPKWSIDKFKPKVLQLFTTKLRGILIQLVLNYPQRGGCPSYDELYAIDLLGMLISTCDFQFLWSNVTSTSVKPRNLAPRVLSATLKYNHAKEWLSTVFLRETGADVELANAWLLGTLDMATLKTDPILCGSRQTPIPIGNASSELPATKCQDSNYWVMLTDGIIYHLLRPDPPVGFRSMDPMMKQLLHAVATTCKFPQAVSDNIKGLDDAETLYDLHLDVFRAFCRSTGSIWHEYSLSVSQRNHLRAKTMKLQSGIFVSFVESYKLNFRRVCGEIDQLNHDWRLLSELLLQQAGEVSGGQSYHDLDDRSNSFDSRLARVTTMFRFMYQCMDAFLFFCGEMTFGKDNLFFSTIDLLFQQVSSTEFTVATKRLAQECPNTQTRVGVRDVNAELQQGFGTPALSFVKNVQLFFARQKYPSLLHWFAQTSGTYQTFDRGWSTSRLRKLLVNVLDPDGPLGIYSYYPDEHDSKRAKRDVPVGVIRREAFYLSCGLFNCKCTKSFEHSRSQTTVSSGRIKRLRGFVLNEFVRKTLDFSVKEGGTCFVESMVPLCQFVRAVLNHANLNHDRMHAATGDHQEQFEPQEVMGCLELLAECLIKVIPAEEVPNSTISCVLVIELCGIVSESIALNDNQPSLELINWIELVLCYLNAIFTALSATSAYPMTSLFNSCVCVAPSEKLRTHRFPSSDFRDVLMERIGSLELKIQDESYEINLMRAKADVVAKIDQAMKRCGASLDERLRSITTLAPSSS